MNLKNDFKMSLKPKLNSIINQIENSEGFGPMIFTSFDHEISVHLFFHFLFESHDHGLCHDFFDLDDYRAQIGVLYDCLQNCPISYYCETIRCCTGSEVVEVGSILVLDDIREGCFDVAADESFEEGDIGEKTGCSEEGIAAYLESGQGDIGSEEGIVPSSEPEEGDTVLLVAGLAEV